MKIKPCIRCGGTNRRKPRPDNRHGDCKDCAQAKSRQWCVDHPKEIMIRNAKNRSLKTGCPFDITAKDFEIPEVCPVLNIPMVRGVGKNSVDDNSPSLDKIVPSLGYVKGNIRVISYRANVLKSDATPEEINMLNVDMQKLAPLFNQVSP